MVEAQILNDISLLDQRIAEKELTPYKNALDVLKRISKLPGGGVKQHTFPIDIMTALLDLVRSLADHGRIEEAQNYLAECIGLFGKNSDTETSRRWLAEALSLRSLLSQHACNDLDALKYAQDAVEVCQKLVTDYGSVYKAHLAASLMNLGCRYHDLNETDHAISTTQQAISLAREQSSTQSLEEQFRTLGEALTQLSFVQLRAAPEEALEYALEALSLARAANDASRVGDNSFTPILAGAVTHCVDVLLTLRRRDEVHQFVQELKDLYKSFTSNETQRGELIEALLDAAKLLLKHREFEHALEVVTAVKESQAGITDDHVSADVAFTLAACYSEVGLSNAARLHIQQCILHYDAQGSSALQELASAHSEHSRILLKAQELVGSISAAEKAVEVQRRVVMGSEDTYQLVSLGAYLVEVSHSWLLTQQWHMALEATNEAIQICQDNLEVPEAHTCLAGAYLGKVKAYAGLQDHANVIETADRLQLILQTSLEEDGGSPSTFANLFESVGLMIPSLEKLERKEELVEARELIKALSDL
ncbi:hypothetical protein FRB96_009657 [Tulasnella sp. 330]|nr:hypothetical protein FRB96_009657 [Tulasnella sp. 330]KAG8883293.1 hypothetical protein FRB97_006857 [Tulasnella sp. 331]